METDSLVQPNAQLPHHTQPPDPLEGTLVLPNEPTASGGFGDIYKATWIRGGEESTVCVKRLPIHRVDVPQSIVLTREERLQRRIRRETLIWGRATHPNIYPYLGYQVVNGETLLVSPWAEGGNLETFLAHNPDTPYTARIELVKDAAQGLAYLHSQTPPIAHGDLSPRNVLIRVIENVTTAALCDFGLSRVMIDIDEQTGLTTSGTPQGDIAFSANELASDTAKSTNMSDVYALGGVVLFGMSGKYPFHKMKSIAAIIVAIHHGKRPNPRDHPDLPEADPLWTLLEQCWNPVPENRPTAEEVVATLGELMEGN